VNGIGIFKGGFIGGLAYSAEAYVEIKDGEEDP
jgi:hypothetical protein